MIKLIDADGNEHAFSTGADRPGHLAIVGLDQALDLAPGDAQTLRDIREGDRFRFPSAILHDFDEQIEAHANTAHSIRSQIMMTAK